MSAPIRWYNRLAAWAWDIVVNPWVGLCNPVWVEQSEADIEAEWDEQHGDDSWIDEALRDAYDEGYGEAENRWREW